MPANPLMLLVAIAAIAIPIASGIARVLGTKKIEELFRAGKFDELLAYLDKPLLKFVFPNFNLSFTRLNTLTALGDTKSACMVADALLAQNLSNQQLAAVLPTLFSTFMAAGEFEKAKPLIEKAEMLCSEAQAQEMRVSYEIVADKSSAYLEQMEASYEACDLNTKLQLAPLIALQYDNKGNKKKVNEWRAIISELSAGSKA